MYYIIRIKEGKVVGTVVGNSKGIRFPEDEVIEIYEEKEEFEERLSELDKQESDNQKPLSVEVMELKQELADSNALVLELMETIILGGM